MCNAVITAEPVIGYQFRNKALLLEALSYPSYDRVILMESYQRLEFLGDAVLDMLVVAFLAEHKPEQSQGRMTQIKAALVNVNLLGFLCLEFSCGQDVISIQEDLNVHGGDLLARREVCAACASYGDITSLLRVTFSAHKRRHAASGRGIDASDCCQCRRRRAGAER